MSRIGVHVFPDSVKIILCPGYTVQRRKQKLLNQFGAGAGAQPLGSKQAGELRKGLLNNCIP